jgi:acetyl-CoA carboxylase carboxyl transferase subunit alpha
VANDETKPRAAEALRLTADHLKKHGVIDDIIPEPVGGAHRNPREMTNTLRAHLTRQLRDLADKPTADLLNERYAKFRRMGAYLEG